MLAKNCGKKLFDAHFHYPECAASGCADLAPDDVSGCSCAHSEHGWNIQKNLARSCPELVLSFGVHPQNPVRDNLEFLESLLERGEADAVGEAGFDLFTDEFRRNEPAQTEVWNVQLELAEKYGKPLVVHCRRANFRLFADSARLSRIPSVVFHSFMGSPVEALSLRRRGVNAYFSFGKQLLNGNRNAAACVRTIPSEMLLFETDAPFQTLRGESATAMSEIERVYRAAWELSGRSVEFGEFVSVTGAVFRNAFVRPAD